MTFEELMSAARNADAAGDATAARRLVQMARQLQAGPATEPQIPEGMFLNPQTGQLTSRELLANANEGRSGANAAAAGAMQGVTFGFGDELAGLAGYLEGGEDAQLFRTEQARARVEAAQADNPIAYTAGNVGGAVSVPLGAFGAAPAGAGLARRVGTSALATGALSGVYGVGEGEGSLQERALDARGDVLFGAAIGGAVPLAGSVVANAVDGVRASRAARKAARTAPGTDELRTMGGRLYDAVDQAGVQVRAEAFEDARQGILQRLLDQTAFSTRPGGKTLTPNTRAVMDDMSIMSDQMLQYQGAALPIREVDSLRRQAGAAAGNVQSRSDARAGIEVIEGLDELIQNLGPDDVVTGDLQALQSALPKAREIWARMSRSQQIDDAIARGETYISGAASGVRRQFASMLRNKKAMRGFSEAERRAINRVVNGSIPERIVHLMGGGLGQLMAMGGGAATGGIAGGLLGAIGGGMVREASEALARKNAEVARGAIASGALRNLESVRPATGLLEQMARQGTAALLQ